MISPIRLSPRVGATAPRLMPNQVVVSALVVSGGILSDAVVFFNHGYVNRRCTGL